MTDIKKVFSLNSKNYYDLDNSDQKMFDNMFDKLKEIEPLLEIKHSVNFLTNENNVSTGFYTNVPEQLFPKIIEAFVLSRNN